MNAALQKDRKDKRDPGKKRSVSGGSDEDGNSIAIPEELFDDIGQDLLGEAAGADEAVENTSSPISGGQRRKRADPQKTGVDASSLGRSGKKNKRFDGNQPAAAERRSPGKTMDAGQPKTRTSSFAVKGLHGPPSSNLTNDQKKPTHH